MSENNTVIRSLHDLGLIPGRRGRLRLRQLHPAASRQLAVAVSVIDGDIPDEKVLFLSELTLGAAVSWAPGARALVAEALTNAAKHAHASTVHVEAHTIRGDGGDLLRFRVCDDGRGGADPTRGTGLIGLKDRAAALGGHLSIHTAPGAGTTLQAELPLSLAHKGPG